MKSSHAIRGMILLCASWLVCFGAPSPSKAQGPVGLTVTICSKNDPKYQPQTGILVRLDEHTTSSIPAPARCISSAAILKIVSARPHPKRRNARLASSPARAAAPAPQARP